jgi:hypothetical protein
VTAELQPGDEAATEQSPLTTIRSSLGSRGRTAGRPTDRDLRFARRLSGTTAQHQTRSSAYRHEMHLLTAAAEVLEGRWAPVGESNRPVRALTLYDGLLVALGCDPRASTVAYWEDHDLRQRLREARNAIEATAGEPLEIWSNAPDRSWDEVRSTLESARDRTEVQVPTQPPQLRPWCDPARRSSCRIPQVVWGAAAVAACTAPDDPMLATLTTMGVVEDLGPWEVLDQLEIRTRDVPVDPAALLRRDSLSALADRTRQSMAQTGTDHGLLAAYGSPDKSGSFLLRVGEHHRTAPSAGLAAELQQVASADASS